MPNLRINARFDMRCFLVPPVLPAVATSVRLRSADHSAQQLQNRHRLSVMSKMYRWWSTVIGSNAQRNFQLKQLEERVKRRQVQLSLGSVQDSCVERADLWLGARET